MNILHISPNFNYACGVSKNIYLILKNWKSEFPYDNLFFITNGGDSLDRLNGIEVNVNIFSLKKKDKNLFFIGKDVLILLLFCIRNKINIIHSHHRYFDLLAFIISHILNIQTVTTVHSKVFKYKFFSYKSDCLIACSKSIISHLKNEYNIDESRISLIYNCVDLSDALISKTKDELIKQLDIPINKFIIGFFGRLDFKEKGIDILLKAFHNLSKENKDLFLLLVGNGKDDKEVLEFITQNNLAVKFINSQNDIYNYYQLLDLFILPSRVDPFPLVMLEAGLFRIPLIGCKVDGIAEFIEDEKDGLFFEANNCEDLQNKIQKIYNNKTFALQLSKNLHEKVIRDYDIRHFLTDYRNIYLRKSNGI